MSLVGTLAVPLMALGFVAAAHLLARRARKTGIVAGSLLVLGMWGFLAGLTTELIQITALLDGAKGVAAAEWMQGLDSQPLLGIVYGFPFMLGCVLGMLTLTTGLLVKGVTAGREHGRAAVVGLGSMRERVAELGGWCTVEARESGTEVVAVLPLPARVPDPVPAPVAERA